MAFSWKVIKVVLLHLHSLARLFYRRRTHRLWWDDFWAFVALLFDCGMVVVLAILKGTTFKSSLLRWISFITYTSTLWGARLSIAISIVRLVPPGSSGRLVAKCVSVVFVLMWNALLIQKLFICKGNSVDLNVARCQMPRATAILELCTDITADIWLICSPAYLLWDAKLTNRRQILIFSVFASNILLTIASIVHTTFIFRRKGPWMFVFAHIELAISLMTCNLLVLVTWLYSRIYPNGENERRRGRGSSSNSSTTSYSGSDNAGRVAAQATTTTSQMQQQPQRRRGGGVPNYGFDGSVLVLTKISASMFFSSAIQSGVSPSPSSSSSSWYSNSANDTFGRRPYSRPWSRGLTGLYHHHHHHHHHHGATTATTTIAGGGPAAGSFGTLPYRLRPSRSCPAFLCLSSSQEIRGGRRHRAAVPLQFKVPAAVIQEY